MSLKISCFKSVNYQSLEHTGRTLHGCLQSSSIIQSILHEWREEHTSVFSGGDVEREVKIVADCCFLLLLYLESRTSWQYQPFLAIDLKNNCRTMSSSCYYYDIASRCVDDSIIWKTVESCSQTVYPMPNVC